MTIIVRRDLLTSQLLAGTRFARPADTGAKRNLGLLLSHLVGWKRVVFLDDDIEIHDPEYLRQASALLDIYNVVGLSIGGCPDNSVVCHAYRNVGETSSPSSAAARARGPSAT